MLLHRSRKRNSFHIAFDKGQDRHLEGKMGHREDEISDRSRLYTIGCPDELSPVLVTANYKMTVDRVRMNLPEAISGSWSSTYG